MAYPVRTGLGVAGVGKANRTIKVETRNQHLILKIEREFAGTS